MIQLILSRSREVEVALCMDPERADASRVSVFSSVSEVYQKLLRFARKLDVPVKPSIVLHESHYASGELAFLERFLLTGKSAGMPGTPQGEVRGMLCRNEYDEVDCVLSEIARLVQEEGYHYNDVAVISRDLDTYRTKLEAGFRKYGIPFYADQLSGIGSKPLIRLAESGLNCLVKGFTGENVLSLLKCGMTPFSVEEVAELENYVYVWGVSGRQWNTPFLSNPRGYQEGFTEEDTAALERMNRIREFTVSALENFRKKARDASGKKICQALLELLEDLQVRETMEKLIEDFYREENFELAQEYGRLWEILMELLDVLAAAYGEKRISPERFSRLFSQAADTYQMGTLPQALDTVIVGSADRIRIDGKRAVMVVGVNEGVMPYIPEESGVFSDREREQLIGVEIEIAMPSREKIREERFIAYKTLTSPSERLFLTARKSDIAGNLKSPSPIFSELKKMFGEPAILDSADLDGLFYCRSGGASFSQLSKTYLNDTPLTASLKAVLGGEPQYAARIEGLERVLEHREFVLKNRENAIGLFGREMNISPTRVESFYQCRFRYFVEQGLKAAPLRRAELDPLETGTLIHRVLYVVASTLDLREGYDAGKAKAVIKEELDRYIETVMGGVQDKTSRFLYLYNRMRASILKIVEQLHQELLQSEFEPCAFEYEISPASEISPLRLTADDGTQVNIYGKIDRIDSYVSKNGEKYIRIVDYKSGRKQFKLNDVLYGLNLQMLIYLHCITKNGKGRFFQSLPAGILYMPAGEQAPALEREATPEEVERQKQKNYAMNGLLLEDREILRAMDQDMSGLFIPVSLKKDGDFTAASKNSLVSLSELGKINSYIDKLVCGMAQELHDGRIEAIPLADSCGYCSYRGICGITKASQVREYLSLDKGEVLKAMDEELSEEEEEGPVQLSLFSGKEEG